MRVRQQCTAEAASPRREHTHLEREQEPAVLVVLSPLRHPCALCSLHTPRELLDPGPGTAPGTLLLLLSVVLRIS